MSERFFKLRGRAISAARTAREHLGVPPLGPVDDILRRVESDGVGVAILDLGEGIAGAYLPVDGTRIAFVNGADAPQRQRFTLAHEYGHHRLGHVRSVDAPTALADFDTDPDEMQANVFAAEFLIPRPAAKRWAGDHADDPVTLETVVRLAATFGVSAQAACIRLKSADLVAGDRADRLAEEIRAGEHQGMVEALGLEVPDDAIARSADELPRLPAALRDNALGSVLSGRMTLAQLACAIGRTPAEVRATLDATGLGALLPSTN